MKDYFATRHTGLILIGVFVLNVLFAPLARPYGGPRGNELLVYSFPVVLQLAPVALLTLGLSGRMEQFEFASSRPMRRLRALNVMLLSVVGIVAASVYCLLARMIWGEDVAGTVGTFAAVRAVTGLYGIALLGAAWADVRVAWLVAIPFGYLPLAVDFRSGGWAGDAFGFVLADEQSVVATVTVGILWVAGAAAHVLLYSERQAPSTNRRALLDARRQRR